VGSGYGTSLAREVIGPEGLVVAVELDAATLAFARENLRRAGYTDVVLVRGDGGFGYPSMLRTIGSASPRPARTSRRR
jgi:protein-L-isoaspartate(D-aspartate) O-methyltransferase